MEVARFSGLEGRDRAWSRRRRARTAGTIRRAVRDAAQSCARRCSPKAPFATPWSSASRPPVRGEFIDIAMFYISDRDVIDALLAASRRGVDGAADPRSEQGCVRAREDRAFRTGRSRASWSRRAMAPIHVRWYRTHGEQFHTKLVMVYGADRLWMSLGSANLTRRNIGDYNLEANVALEAARSSPLGTAGAGVLRNAVEQPGGRWASSTPRTSASTRTPRRGTTGSTASWSRLGCRRSERAAALRLRHRCASAVVGRLLERRNDRAHAVLFGVRRSPQQRSW